MKSQVHVGWPVIYSHAHAYLRRWWLSICSAVAQLDCATCCTTAGHVPFPYNLSSFCFWLSFYKTPRLLYLSNSECLMRFALPVLSVGRRRPFSRLRWSSEGAADALAPVHSEAVPHTAVRMLQPGHVGGGCRGSTESGGRQLEGRPHPEASE